MVDIDFIILENDLNLVIPDAYRLFIKSIIDAELDLKKYGIYNDTSSILKGNSIFREALYDLEKEHYFDFGIGDGCGNYFFIKAQNRYDNRVILLSHDPEGIEDRGSATMFLQRLLSEIKANFEGPDKYSFQGNGNWDCA